MTTPIYRISDKSPGVEPVKDVEWSDRFLLWFYGTVGTASQYWIRLSRIQFSEVRDLCTHWSPDAPTAPDCVPGVVSIADAASTPEWAERLVEAPPKLRTLLANNLLNGSDQPPARG